MHYVAQRKFGHRAYHIPWFSRISPRAYDRYLRFQRVREGMQNYSQGITLLGEAWRKGLVGSGQQRRTAE